MTYLQSLERIKRNTEPKFWNAEDIKHYNNIVNALEKQIPKKPDGDLHSVPHYRCPNCHRGVLLFVDDKKHPCCQWCGQALDWSETE